MYKYIFVMLLACLPQVLGHQSNVQRSNSTPLYFKELSEV